MEQNIDIREINIEETLPKEEKIKRFIEIVKNPYEFRVGEVKVRTSFSDTQVTMQERMTQYFEQMLA